MTACLQKTIRKRLYLHRVGAVALLAISICFINNATASASSITFMTHSVSDQTYIDDNGQLRGKENGGRRAFYVELIREMGLMLDENINPEVLPFKRALALLQSEPNRALFNVNRTSSRENMMKWVGPLHSSTTHLYENISAPTGAKSLEDAKQVASICVLRGNVHHRFFEKTGFENLYLANSYASCIRMLSNRRVSMTPLSNISSLVLRPDSETAQKLKKTDIMVMESKGFLAFSRQIPDEIINRWQDALNRIRASGRYDELVEQYLFGE